MNWDENITRTSVLSRGLGWFSIGLGLTQLIAPRRVAKLIGIHGDPALMRMLGIRETASGVAILAGTRPAMGLWSRVVGDGMDLALLTGALASNNVDKSKVRTSTAAVAGVTALDVVASIRASRLARIRSAKSVITVNRPQADVYEFWRDTNNLEHFMKSVVSGVEIVTARPNEFIEFRSRDGAVIRSGSVVFKPAFGDKATEIHGTFEGTIPERLLHEDLRRSKRLMETGEIATTEGQSAGPRRGALLSRIVHQLEGKEVA